MGLLVRIFSGATGLVRQALADVRLLSASNIRGTVTATAATVPAGVSSGGAKSSNSLGFEILRRSRSSNQRIERPRARAGHNQSDRGCQQRQRELDATWIEESLFQVNE